MRYLIYLKCISRGVITISKLLILVAIPLAIAAVIFTNVSSGDSEKGIQGLVQGQKTEAEKPSQGNSNKYLNNSIDKLQQVEKTTKDKEIKGEVEEIIEETEQSDLDISESIASIEARPKLVKLIVGPDYKNAGQVRRELVQLRNQISKLERMGDSSQASTTTKNITESVETLKEELAAVETRLYESLQGFSLFGWLGKLLTGFVPASSSTPTPTAEASPSASAEATVEPTVEPTIEPTVEPSTSPTLEPTVAP